MVCGATAIAADQMTPLYRLLPDEQLAQQIQRLERKCAALRFGQSAIASKLIEDYLDALTEARAEAERRRT